LFTFFRSNINLNFPAVFLNPFVYFRFSFVFLDAKTASDQGGPAEGGKAVSGGANSGKRTGKSGGQCYHFVPYYFCLNANYYS
jgi:hypothetical protein